MYGIAGLFFMIAAAHAGVEINSLQDIVNARNQGARHLILKDIYVPAGETLDLQGFNHSTIEFTGKITFGYKEFSGVLVIIKGAGYTVLGQPGHVIDGEGQRWWDGLGGKAGAKAKPYFIYVQLEQSVIKGLNVKNSPMTCFAINGCQDLEMFEITVDNSLGHKLGGHNTDGFDVAKCHNVTIRNSKVDNQDDCLDITSGSKITFENNECVGGHGIALAVGGYDANTAEDIIIRNCKVYKNNIGIRIKTNVKGDGYVRRVTFDNIHLQDISEIGIVIIGNYLTSRGGPVGEPNGKIPIEDLTINNVRGNVLKNGSNHWIYVAPGSGKNWVWNSNVQGGMRPKHCKGQPAGLNVECGK